MLNFFKQITDDEQDKDETTSYKVQFQSDSDSSDSDENNEKCQKVNDNIQYLEEDAMRNINRTGLEFSESMQDTINSIDLRLAGLENYNLFRTGKFKHQIDSLDNFLIKYSFIEVDEDVLECVSELRRYTNVLGAVISDLCNDPVQVAEIESNINYLFSIMICVIQNELNTEESNTLRADVRNALEELINSYKGIWEE